MKMYLLYIIQFINIYHYIKSWRFIYDFNWFKDVRGSLNKFPDFFRMGTFIDSTHMNL